MTDIIGRVVRALRRARAENRRPVRLLIGNLEADELAVALRPLLRPRPPDDEPLLPLDLKGVHSLFDVPIERVDQPMLLGVVTEDRA